MAVGVLGEDLLEAGPVGGDVEVELREYLQWQATLQLERVAERFEIPCKPLD